MNNGLSLFDGTLTNLELCIALTYQPHHALSDEAVRDVVAQAFAEVRARFQDFDKLLPEIEALWSSLTPNWSQMAPEQYLESLYLVVKHSSFMEPSRNAARDRAVLAWLESAPPVSKQAQ